MKTQDLIVALAEDAEAHPVQSFRLTFQLGLAAAIFLAAVVFWLLLGPRSDFLSAMQTWRFPFKFLVTGLLGASLSLVAFRLARPGVELGWSSTAVILAPLLLAIAVIIELVVLPSPIWVTRMVGTHSMTCLKYVPTISALPLAAILLAMRRGAPGSPATAGLVAGLAAGAFGAMFYAAQCPDDSPLFVVVWYPLAIGIVGLVGSALGARLLKW